MAATRPTSILVLAGLMACAVVGAGVGAGGCGSSTAAPTPTHPAGEPYLSRTGTGDATLPQISLPDRWTLLWRFDCADPVSPRAFTLSATPSGGATTQVTRQVGLRGGGYKPVTSGGNYVLTVTTTCSWQVVADTPGIQTIPSTVPG